MENSARLTSKCQIIDPEVVRLALDLRDGDRVVFRVDGDRAVLARTPVQSVVADQGYRGLAKLAARRQVRLDIKAPPKGSSGFVPIGPLWRVEHAFAQLGRWRRLSRCHEGTAESARA